MNGEGRFRGNFWLDGGYDREEVEACVYHPNHRWIVIRVKDVHPEKRCADDEMMVICRNCTVPRCGYSTESNPCMLPRHHEERHRYADGSEESAEHWPGCDKPDPPELPILGVREGSQ